MHAAHYQVNKHNSRQQYRKPFFSPLHGSCYMYLHVSEMYVEDDSSNLNVMHSILVNGSGCINTISWESYTHIHPRPPGTVNVLILQRGALIKLFHEFQWDSLY